MHTTMYTEVHKYLYVTYYLIIFQLKRSADHQKILTTFSTFKQQYSMKPTQMLFFVLTFPFPIMLSYFILHAILVLYTQAYFSLTNLFIHISNIAMP